MIKKSVFVTRDNRYFDTYEEAKIHAENCYGKAITSFANTLCKTDGKYIKIIGVLDNSSEVFKEILDLKADIDFISEVSSE